MDGFVQNEFFPELTDGFPVLHIGTNSAKTKTMLSVMDNMDSYLNKGTVLESLAKECYERTFALFSLSELEETLYSISLSKDDTLPSIIRKIARKVTRPLLRSMQSADDDYAKQLLSLIDFDVSLRITDNGEVPLGYVLSTAQRKSTADSVLELTLREDGYEPLVILGAKNTTHSGKYKCALWKNGLASADLGEVLALLIILTEIKAAFSRIAQFRGSETDDIVYHKFLSLQETAREAYYSSSAKHGVCGFMPGDNDIFKKEVWISTKPSERPIPLMMQEFKKHNVSIQEFSSRRKLRNRWEDLYDKGAANLPVYVGRERSVDLYSTCFMEICDIHYHDFLHQYDATGDYWPFFSTNLDKSWYFYGCFSIYHLVQEMYLCLHGVKAEQVASFKYFKNLKGEYAKSYQQKKNIPRKTLQAMSDSILNQYFGYVEFDESCDLSKVDEITKEFIAVKETFFPFVDSTKNAIRFRLLGKHKAYGLYYPFVKCLCVDVRHPSSLIHEYGHLVDYEFGNLSKSYSFLRVREAYEERLQALANGADSIVAGTLNGKTKYNLAYYLEPTEIFARCLELYISKVKGVTNSLLPQEFSFAYPTDEDFLEIVSSYFDTFFDRMGALHSGKISVSVQ